MFSQLSESSYLNSKLNIFIACAPIVNLKNTGEKVLSRTASQWWIVQDTAKKLGVYEIRDPKLDKDLREFCDTFASICDALNDWFHLTSPYADPASIALENSRPSSSASTKQILHYA